MTRVNIHVPDSIHKEFKISAALKGVTLKDLIVQAVKEEVNNIEKKQG